MEFPAEILPHELPSNPDDTTVSAYSGRCIKRPARIFTNRSDALIKREMLERQIPGLQVAVVQQGRIVLLRSYGFADVQDSSRVTNQTRFAINSCTKAFTGVAIMQLVEDGKLDLASPVSRYIHGLPSAWQPVTIRQLLTHVSGLPNILRVLDPVTNGLTGSEESAWAKVKAIPMDFPTGEQFSYNQTNYALLGKIIDTLSGKPFAQVFQDRQFSIAGMSHVAFGDSRDVIPNMAQQYRYIDNIDGQPLSPKKLTHFYWECPPFRRTATGLNSTAEDVARWLIALQQGKLLKTKTSLTTLWTPGTYNNGSPTQWALGWVPKPRLKHRAVTATGGARSAFFIYPDDDLAIVVLTNLSGSYPEEFIDELAGCYNPAIPASDPISALNMQLRQRGFHQAIDVAKDLMQKDPNFRIPETDLNDWAYRILRRGKTKEAIELFKLNVWLYPESWNVYDSYGEALFLNDQKAQALTMYKKSVELNPNNRGGKAMIERLQH